MRIALSMLLAVAVACGGESTGDEAPDSVTGLIVDIRREGGAIASFSVETSGEHSYDVAIDPRRDYGFDLEHLVVHRDQELPVLVRLEERDGALVAIEILDA